MADVTVQKKEKHININLKLLQSMGKENLKISQDSQQKAKQNKQVLLHTMSI